MGGWGERKLTKKAETKMILPQKKKKSRKKEGGDWCSLPHRNRKFKKKNKSKKHGNMPRNSPGGHRTATAHKGPVWGIAPSTKKGVRGKEQGQTTTLTITDQEKSSERGENGKTQTRLDARKKKKKKTKKKIERKGKKCHD